VRKVSDPIHLRPRCVACAIVSVLSASKNAILMLAGTGALYDDRKATTNLTCGEPTPTLLNEATSRHSP
jgi:hypothetical protein